MRPAAHEWDEREETPWPIIKEAASVGIYRPSFLGHAISDPTGLMLPVALEELFWGDAGIGMSIFGDVARASPRSPATARRSRSPSGCRSASARRSNRRSPRSASPSPTPAPTSPSLKTRAVYQEATDEWLINGQKTWVSNGGIANVHVVVASVDPALGSRGQASFVIPPGTPGLRQGAKFKKHGIRASHTAEVFLDDVRVPGRCLLGGKEKLDARLARAREGGHSGASRRRCRRSRRRGPRSAPWRSASPAPPTSTRSHYAKERKQFGRPIIENQAISFTLADMKMEIDAARLLVWRAAWMARNGRKFENAEGSMSKLKAGEVAVWATERAIQILGGIGYTREAPVERWHRDAKIYTIFEGTSEIQRLVIARSISGMRLP